MRKWFSHAASTVPETTPTAIAADIASGAAIQIIDVRELNEWRSGHIREVRHIPLGQLSQHASEIDPDRPAIFVCRSGNRGEHATHALRQAGYDQAANLAGGMLAWQRAGLPVAN